MPVDQCTRVQEIAATDRAEIGRGELVACGLSSRDLHILLPDKSKGQISRLIKRFRVHGLVKKVAHRYRYYLTELGRQAATLALKLRELQAVPALTHFRL